MPSNLDAHLTWPLPNIWIGASASTQADLDRVAPELLRIPAAVRFLSLEPLLGEMEFGPYTLTMRPCPECEIEDAACDQRGTISHQINCGWRRDRGDVGARGIDWVITGGESGPNARPCHVDWLRSIVRQCREAGAAVWVKQLGSNPVGLSPHCTSMLLSKRRLAGIRDRAGADMSEWPKDLRVREMPEVKP